jgi:hypothetical protein
MHFEGNPPMATEEPYFEFLESIFLRKDQKTLFVDIWRVFIYYQKYSRERAALLN